MDKLIHFLVCLCRACETPHHGAAEVHHHSNIKRSLLLLRTKVLAKTHNQITSPERSEMNYATNSIPRCSKIFTPNHSDYILLRAKRNTAAATRNQMKIGTAPLWGWYSSKQNQQLFVTWTYHDEWIKNEWN